MKKLILIPMSLCFFAAAFSQDADTKNVPVPKKQATRKIKDDAPVSLEGKSFKITFTEKKVDAKAVSGVSSDHSALPADKPDYSTFDANSKVILTFQNGNLLAPIFSGTGCPYNVNSSGGDLVAFSAYCKLNSGNEPAETGTTQPGHDTKMEIEADNAGKAAISEKAATGELSPQTMPVDETKQHLPAGTARNDNAEMNNTPPASDVPSPAVRSEEIQRQSESPVSTQHSMMATISGLVSGNSIQGTLSWATADGKKMIYTYSGSIASKKDADDSHVVGLK